MRPTAGVQSIAAFLYDLKRLFDSIVQERGVVLFTGIRVRQRFSMVSMNAKKCNMCAIMAPAGDIRDDVIPGRGRDDLKEPRPSYSRED